MMNNVGIEPPAKFEDTSKERNSWSSGFCSAAAGIFYDDVHEKNGSTLEHMVLVFKMLKKLMVNDFKWTK